MGRRGYEAMPIIADAHCTDGRRFVVRADEKLMAFLELERAAPQTSG
jgi:hypothetical protein